MSRRLRAALVVLVITGCIVAWIWWSDDDISRLLYLVLKRVF